MTTKTEQLDRAKLKGRYQYRQFVKKRSRRRMRRLGKRYRDDAPKKYYYYGWE